MGGAPAIEVEFPDIGRWAAGNTGIPYVWRFESERAGPRITVQALTHGNEVCGAIALDGLLAQRLAPARGALMVVFANVAAGSHKIRWLGSKASSSMADVTVEDSSLTVNAFDGSAL